MEEGREGFAGVWGKARLGQVLWKCKERVGSGEVERKESPENMMPRSAQEKESKDKAGFSFPSPGQSRGQVPCRAGSREVRCGCPAGAGYTLSGGDFPSSCLLQLPKAGVASLFASSLFLLRAVS